MNSAPRPSPSLRASTRPPCISTSRFTSVSPMPRPPSARSSVRSACVNRSKTCGSRFGAIPSPVSRTRMATHVAFALRLEADLPAIVRVLGGVVEQIREHLRDAREIAHRVGPAARQVHREVMLAQPDERTARLDGRLHDLRELDRLLLQRDLPAHHARHIEQIVDEPHEMLRLPLDDGTRPLDLRPAGRSARSETARRCGSGASGLRSSCASIARNSSLRWFTSFSASSAWRRARDIQRDADYVAMARVLHEPGLAVDPAQAVARVAIAILHFARARSWCTPRASRGQWRAAADRCCPARRSAHPGRRHRGRESRGIRTRRTPDAFRDPSPTCRSAPPHERGASAARSR